MSYEYMQGMGSINITAEEAMSYEYMQGMGMGKGEYNPLAEGPLIADILEAREDNGWSSHVEHYNPYPPVSCSPGWWKWTVAAGDWSDNRKAKEENCIASGHAPGTGLQPPSTVYCCPPKSASTSDPSMHRAFLEAQLLAQAQQQAMVPHSCDPPWSMQRGRDVSALLEQGCRDVGAPAGQSEPPVYRYCCPPATPVVPAANGNGTTVTNGAVTNGAAVTNGNGVVVAEEKKYFGFTAQQLMIMGAGGFLLYMVLK